MHVWKIGIGSAVITGAIMAAFFFIEKEALFSGSAGAATQTPAAAAMPAPVTKIVKKTIPIYLEYSARTESIRDISLQAKISGYVQQQQVEDGADVKAGALLSPMHTNAF